MPELTNTNLTILTNQQSQIEMSTETTNNQPTTPTRPQQPRRRSTTFDDFVHSDQLSTWKEEDDKAKAKKGKAVKVVRSVSGLLGGKGKKEGEGWKKI